MIINAATDIIKSVGDPSAEFESLAPLWKKSRALCSGERYVKSFDAVVDTRNFKNLLIPFSPSMTQVQYNFYKAEAELPGVTAQYAKMLVGGLLRKQPALTFSAAVPAEAMSWISDEFGADSTSLMAFLDVALWEEIQTSRAWVFVDYPETVEGDETAYRPYPIVHSAETVINVRTREVNGESKIDRVILRGFTESYVDENGGELWHPRYIDTVWVHELVDNLYQIRKFVLKAPVSQVPVLAGQVVKTPEKNKQVFTLEDTKLVLVNGKRISMIPGWPLNGQAVAPEPMLMSIIDKELSLYNKLSRRNHLLYGAATYTPIISSDMSDEAFQEIVDSGLGTWIKLRQGDVADILKTPTEALDDMQTAIVAGFEELAKLGVRMLSPENVQSGIALEIRNASQTAQLGSLNSKISAIMRQIILFMINWRYNLELTLDNIQFSLSADFDPVPLGAEWLRLATEWYQQGLIPRSVWLNILKINDMVPPEYNDVEGRNEIQSDMDLTMKASEDYAKSLSATAPQ